MSLRAFGVSERLACRVLGQHRSTQRKIPTTPDDEAALTADIIALATSTAATAIAGSRRCCERRRLGGERQARRADLAAGGAEGSAEAAEDEAGSGSTTDRAFGCGRNSRTMSGPTTSSRIAPMTDGSIAC